MPGLDGAPFALVVGDRSPRKNVGFVVDLWPDVLALRPDARLVLVGPPGWGTNQELPGLSALIARGSVVEAGLVSDATLRWAYENAAVTLCPSRLEGFGLPVVEALGFGCPVVHSTDAAQVEAAQGHGIAMSLDDRRGWIDAIVRRLDTGSGTRPVMASPQRSWGDAGAELVAAVRAARARPVTTAVPASGGR
jgi:glycosyltransferase involved in cell wall biosynthesis